MMACSDPSELKQLAGTLDLTAAGLPQDLTEVNPPYKKCCDMCLCGCASNPMQLLPIAGQCTAVLHQSLAACLQRVMMPADQEHANGPASSSSAAPSR